MALYAFVTGGTVTGLCSPPDGQTLSQVGGLTSEQIASAVVVPAGQMAGVGWTESGGVFSPPAGPAPTLAQQAQAALNAGMQLTSTDTPALNGTYACDQGTFQQVSGVVAAIGAGLGLPGGGTTFNWPDKTGTPHAFTAANFTAFAKATMDFLYTLNAIAASNTGTLPAQPVTIA